MAKNTSMWLGEHFEKFIKKRISSGRYSSASEVVRAGLRLLEEEESKLDKLRQELIRGEESGEPRSVDKKAFKSKMRAKHADGKA